MTNLDIKERQVGNVTVLDIVGNIRIGDANGILRTTIRQLVKDGKHQILLNLSGAAYIDSSGLGEFIASYVALNKVGGKLKLLHLTRRVRELMTITKLVTVFDIYDTELEAIESFNSNALEIKETPIPFVREVHNKPVDDDLGLPESPIDSNYSDQLWNPHRLAQSRNRSSESTGNALSATKLVAVAEKK